MAFRAPAETDRTVGHGYELLEPLLKRQQFQEPARTYQLTAVTTELLWGPCSTHASCILRICRPYRTLTTQQLCPVVLNKTLDRHSMVTRVAFIPFSFSCHSQCKHARVTNSNINRVLFEWLVHPQPPLMPRLHMRKLLLAIYHKLRRLISGQDRAGDPTHPQQPVQAIS